MDGQTDPLFVLQCILSWQLGCDLAQDWCGMPRKAASATSTFHDLDVSVLTKFMSPFIKGEGARQFCFKIKHNLDLSDID